MVYDDEDLLENLNLDTDSVEKHSNPSPDETLEEKVRRKRDELLREIFDDRQKKD
jgi:hypothetical protein